MRSHPRQCHIWGPRATEAEDQCLKPHPGEEDLSLQECHAKCKLGIQVGPHELRQVFWVGAGLPSNVFMRNLPICWGGEERKKTA